MGGFERTGAKLVVAEGLPEDTVQLPHPPQPCRRPAVRRDARFDLLSQGRDQLGLGCKVVQHVRGGLRRVSENRLWCQIRAQR